MNNAELAQSPEKRGREWKTKKSRREREKIAESNDEFTNSLWQFDYFMPRRDDKMLMRSSKTKCRGQKMKKKKKLKKKSVGRVNDHRTPVKCLVAASCASFAAI